MIITYLVGMFILALANACVLSICYRKQISTYITTLFYSVVVANFGLLALALSKSLEGALVAIKISYLGASFLPLLFLLVILQVCKFNFPTMAKILLLLFSANVFGLSCTIGYTDIYYKSIHFISENGVGNYLVEYGPAHILWDLLLVGFTLSNIFVILYAAKEKKNVSYKNLVMLAILELTTIIIFIVARSFNCDPLIMPLIYVLDEFALLYISLHIKMYDIKYSVLESLTEQNELAFVAFSSNGNYLGCNDIALQYFPEFSNYRIDHVLDADDDSSKLFNDILKNDLSSEQEKTFVITFRDKHYKLMSRVVSTSAGSEKILFLIEDITKTQQYIQWLNSNKTELESKVESNKKQIQALQEQIIVGMAQMVESRDANTGGHIKRSSDVVAILAREMKKDSTLSYDENFYNALISAAPMHDLGKIAIDDGVLRKPGKFSSEEFEEMKTHSSKGAAIVENLLTGIESPYFVDIAKNVALSHHERWDGSGYPNRLVGENIPIEARIMAIADVYDALVSKRCYKEKMTFEEANKIIISSMGTHFDPSLQKYYESCRADFENYYSNKD